MSDPPRAPFTALYLAAGLSSRFGFRVKCLQEVGRSGETLLELSVRQLLPHGVGDLVLVVSSGTYEAIHAVVGDVFLGLPVTYVFQVTPEYRKKPLGTVHALLAAEGALVRPFLVLNGDTLYGDAALAPVCAHLTRQSGGGGTTGAVSGGSGGNDAGSGGGGDASTDACMPGYPLKDVLPRAGRVNRAVIQVGAGGTLDAIVEQYDIGMADIEAGIYSGDELTSMNIFAFPLPVVAFARRKFDAWLAAHSTEEVKEYILSTMLNDLRAETGIGTRVVAVGSAVPLELTNPDDLAYVKNNLQLVGL
ncbi:hypothetical protein MMPV_000653 [Pyropia vietnamensis]